MSAGPFTLVAIGSREPVCIGDTRATIRARDALRYQAVITGLEAPSPKHPAGRVHYTYVGGGSGVCNPGFVNAEFIEIGGAL